MGGGVGARVPSGYQFSSQLRLAPWVVIQSEHDSDRLLTTGRWRECQTSRVAEPPTIIARFLAEVDAELRRDGAAGAAEHTWRAAAILEPYGRVARSDAEQQRLLLLADRVARHLTPLTVATVRDDGLNEVVRQQPPVRDRGDAASAAQHVGGLRDLLCDRPDGPLTRTPAGVASALAPLQTMLWQVAKGDPDRPEVTAVTAVPHAAHGLVACFAQAAAFADGIPGETRATVAILDALDDERTAPWGSRARERTAHESDLHRSLVRSLVSSLALQLGQITHADDGALPLPPTVGRHRPDLAGRTATGDLFLGEAKLGPELFEDHTQEQLADFLDYAPDGIPVALHLIVPAGWGATAEAAAKQAGGATDRLTVHELRGIQVASPLLAGS